MLRRQETRDGWQVNIKFELFFREFELGVQGYKQIDNCRCRYSYIRVYRP